MIFLTYDDTQPPEGKEMEAHDAIKAHVDKATGDLCVNCGATLPMDKVDAYDHHGGWFIITEMPRQWLSIQCRNCKYEVSLTKLGVPR